MIDLTKEKNDRLYDERTGLLLKHWLIFNDERYLFKANYRYPMENTFSNFGEVFYSKVLKRLGVNVVDASFAVDSINGSKAQGVIVKNFLTQEYMDSITYKKVFDFYIKSGADCKYSSVEVCVLAIKDFAKRFDFTLDEKKIKTDLEKMCICDFFFAQSDRHDNNIEFLFTHDNVISVAPAFDNGLCLGFAYFDTLSEFYANRPDNKEFLGGYTIFTISDIDEDYLFTLPSRSEFFKGNDKTTEKMRERQQLRDITNSVKSSKNIQKLVTNIISTNIEKEIDEMEADCGFGINDSYKIVCDRIFKNRVALFEKFLIENNENELVEKLFNGAKAQSPVKIKRIETEREI